MLIDIFNNRAFNAVEMTGLMNDIPYRPDFLGSFGERLFNTKRSRFRLIAIMKRNNQMTLIPVSPIGAPPVELETPGADARTFATRRIAKASTVYAEELQGVLQLPELERLQTVQAELAQRALTIRADVETTHEHMRMGAVFGKVVDADGTTVLDNWYKNWDVPEPVVTNHHLDVKDTNLRQLFTELRDSIFYSAPNSWVNGQTEIHALCGKDYFDLLTSHPMVERAFLNTPAAQQLLTRIPDTFEFAGVFFHKYRGTPGGEFSVADNEARFFPVGARDAFQRVLGPAEFNPYVNTPGLDVYGLSIVDRDRDAWQRTEAYSYPLYVCCRPEMLRVATAR